MRILNCYLKEPSAVILPAAFRALKRLQKHALQKFIEGFQFHTATSEILTTIWFSFCYAAIGARAKEDAVSLNGQKS